MKTYVAVPGTWAWRDRHDPEAWFQPTSPFAATMRTLGYEPLRSRPFQWTTRINGNHAWRRWLALFIPCGWERGDQIDWQAAAPALVDYCEIGTGPDVIIAHSHAGQVVAYAASEYGLRVPLVITVSTPPRDDMEGAYYTLTKSTRWRHLYDGHRDLIGGLGMIGDGALFGQRSMDYALENIKLEGVSHTGILNDPSKLHLWATEGWLA